MDEYARDKEAFRAILEALRITPPLPASATDRLVADAPILPYGENATIFGPDDTHHFSYAVVRGRVRLETVDHAGHPLVVQMERQGRLFGVEWLPGARQREMRAVADAGENRIALITQETVAKVFSDLSLAHRLGIMSYAWRALSSLVVRKAEARGLALRDRVVLALRGMAQDFGEPTPNGVRLALRLTAEDIGALVGAESASVRHVLMKLAAAGVVSRDNGHLVLRSVLPADGTEMPPGGPYRGVAAPWARGRLCELLARCDSLGLSHVAKQVIGREATLWAVPAGELLVPADTKDGVAFIVSGSAWMEGRGSLGRAFTIQLVPHSRFVRLPTGHASDGTRLWSRAHSDVIVGLLTLEQMREVIDAMRVEGALRLLHVTCRDLSRHLCNSTTAPTRTVPCRLLHAFLFLAHDFGKSVGDGIAIKTSLTLADLARLVDAQHPAVARAFRELRDAGWVDRVAPQRYVLKRIPRREPAARRRCPICSPDPGA